MRMTTQAQRANPLLITVLLLSLAAVLVAWLSIPDALSEIPPVSLSDSRLLLLLLAFFFTQFSLACLNLMRPGQPRIAAGLLLVFLMAEIRWLQLYSEIGVFALNGDQHWVHRAATASEDEEAKEYLRIVLRSTRYGANQADNEVLDLPPEDQRRLFSLLIDLVPGDQWRRHFEYRIREAGASRSGRGQ